MKTNKHPATTVILLLTSHLVLSATSRTSYANELMFAVTALGSHNGTLLTVDLQSGQVHEIGPRGMGLGLDHTVSIAAHPNSGILYVDSNTTSANGLVKVDRATGLATLVGLNDLLNELAFDASGSLYTQIAPANIGATGPIGQVSLADGSTTPLAGGAISRLFGLAYNPEDGFLYGLSFDNLLYKIGTNGQVFSSIQVASTEIPGGIAFDKTGQLVGSDLAERLFNINLLDGSISNIRSVLGGYPIQGLALIIPEPPMLLLPMQAAVVWFACRRRQAPHNHCQRPRGA